MNVWAKYMDKERTWACMMLMYRGFGSIFCYKYSKKIKGTTSLLKFSMASGTNKSPRFFVLSMSIFDKVVGIHTYYVSYNYAYLRLVCKCTSNFKCKLSRKNDIAKASFDYRNLTQIESKNKIPKLKLISNPFMNWIYQPFSIEKREHNFIFLFLLQLSYTILII